MTRAFFFQSCTRVLQSSAPAAGPAGYFLMVDLDRFKSINDRMGHPVGDQVLRAVSRKLREAFGREALIGRLGGDEFALLLPAPVDRAELEAMLERFRSATHQLVRDGQPVTCSVGAAPVTPSEPPDALYQAADRLLYDAKTGGRDR